MSTPQVTGAGPIEAWVAACEYLEQQPRQTAYHLTARITSSRVSQPRLSAIDALLVSRGLQPTETVANTVFPSRLAERCSSIEQLSERYRALLPKLKGFNKNQSGTYFGRLVSYPDGGKYSDQLVHTVTKMRREMETGRSFTSIFECSIYHPGRDAGKSMKFPCLSFCAFHLDHHERSVHLMATYRNHYMFERALGNYIGLARLRDYVAAQVGFDSGELMVVSGHAQLETARTDVRNLLASQLFAGDTNAV